ncbi:VirB4 family type IV secretion/conjugal transfer ATPase [Zophobihabitans entericus]|uniref:Type IV secretion system protein virB4 n=1 Tax=Zophobihabitans entericus TaxID=1635327 RepID=A0A6G9IFY1_9GAMM|nr:VirB4 family type IV secretion/conjugal transfer ATPase [Zophobihabitans entericus]QIQ22520.1 VirB4 family type IV secretion/conjugal transfer ATPase [Zophobihabitans entericus]
MNDSQLMQLITITVVLLSSLLVIILFLQAGKSIAANKLIKHRSKSEGFADLLNYGSVIDPGIILNKNGSLMMAFLYQGDDNASATVKQRENVAFRVNQTLSKLGNGWMVHVDAVRRPANKYSTPEESDFPDQICAGIDEERRRFFNGLDEMYEGYFVLTITYFPPLLAQRKFVEMMFDDDQMSLSKTQHGQEILNTFKRECRNIESNLSSVLKIQRLMPHEKVNEDGSKAIHDDFLRWLQFCITGDIHPVILPNNGMYLDKVIGGKEFYTGVVPKIGNKFIQVVAIDGYPLDSHPGILSALAEQSCEYRWSNRFIFMDRHEAIDHLNKFRKKWRQKVRGFFDQIFNTGKDKVNKDAVAMVIDAEDAIAEVESGLVAEGYHTSVIILMDAERARLEHSAEVISKTINRLGFNARVETINTVDAYLGSLPGHGVENVRRPLIHTLNLTHFLPTSSIWSGKDKAPCPYYPKNSPAVAHVVTSGSTPFRLNTHVGDLGHTMMFGPTGAGKSVHLAFLAAQFRRYKGMSIYAFDKGRSLYALAAGIRAKTNGKSGLHFDIASDDNKLAFCPLQYLSSRSYRAWAADWIDTILALNGLTTSASQRNGINDALVSMSENGGKTLTDFTHAIQDNAIREALQQYTVDGSMGYLLDAEQDGLELSDFTVFEIENLMNLDDRYALPVLLYLFKRIEMSLTGQPCVLLLDEVWLLLGHPVFREKIKEWLKVLRKANAIVIMATQSLSDAENSGIIDVLVESTATKIFLPNSSANEEETAKLYKRMGLNSRQIDIISSAIPKRQYYFASSEGRRLYDLALGPLALSFVAASDKESINEIMRLESVYGENWVDEWLKKKNLDLNDYCKEAA